MHTDLLARSASARLRRKIDLALPAYGAPLAHLLERPDLRELFPRCLIVSYHTSRAMVPLMEAALECALELEPGDPVAAGLAAYLARHIPEERHHPEPGGAVVDDLAALGLDPDEVRALPGTPQIDALVATELAWFRNDHPVAILGFLELEAHVANRRTVELLIERTGYPRAAFGQLLLHSRLDPVHARELHRVLDVLPLEEWHERLIASSALRSIALITGAFVDAIVDGGVAASMAAACTS